MKKLLGVLMLILNVSSAFAIDAGLSPSYLNIKFYKLAVSTSPYCPNLKTIIEDDQGEIFDFLSNPTLGSGTVANGNYPCVVIEMSDMINWAPDQNSDSANCTMGQDYSEEICSRVQDQFQLIDGSSANCTVGEDRVALYLSTASTATGGDQAESTFLPPTPGNSLRGLNLGGALVIGQGISAKFIVNALGKIEDRDNECKFSDPPPFSYQEL
jgi:hypothetical protein